MWLMCKAMSQKLHVYFNKYERNLRRRSEVFQVEQQHEFINTRMANMGKYQNQLRNIVGGDRATTLVFEQLSLVPDATSSVQ